MKDVLPLGNLPLLRRLRVLGNPFAETGNYRTRILGQFGGRAGEVRVVLHIIQTYTKMLIRTKPMIPQLKKSYQGVCNSNPSLVVFH